MSGLAVADTTVWSNFASAQKPRLVLEAFPQIASPRPVLEELDEGRRRGYFAELDLSWIPEVEMSHSEVDQARQLGETLDRGEAACLAIASTRDSLLVTDDRAARQTARSLGVEVSGTLGALVRLLDVERLTVKEADELLARMIDARFRSPVSSLSELV